MQFRACESSGAGWGREDEKLRRGRERGMLRQGKRRREREGREGDRSCMHTCVWVVCTLCAIRCFQHSFLNDTRPPLHMPPLSPPCLLRHAKQTTEYILKTISRTHSTRPTTSATAPSHVCTQILPPRSLPAVLLPQAKSWRVRVVVMGLVLREFRVERIPLDFHEYRPPPPPPPSSCQA